MCAYIIQTSLDFGKSLLRKNALNAGRLLFPAAIMVCLTMCRPLSPGESFSPPTATEGIRPPTPTGSLATSTAPLPGATDSLSVRPTVTATPRSPLPRFDHIVILVLENREFGSVIGKNNWPTANRLAEEHTLLTQYYAITHPSLPNYLAMIGGDTFGITTNCTDCFVAAPTLADQLEAAGLSWRGYFEDMPRPCYKNDTMTYVRKHNPFLYFDSIRNDPARCERSVVPLTQLESDLAADSLPNFVFIIPNQCNNGHDCTSSIADAWLERWVNTLLHALEPRAAQSPYLLVITWEEGQGNHSCCGLPEEGGGRVPLILISPLAKQAYQDDTPYTHYSLLKTIELSWGLPYLGHAAEENVDPILAVWK